MEIVVIILLIVVVVTTIAMRNKSRKKTEDTPYPQDSAKKTYKAPGGHSFQEGSDGKQQNGTPKAKGIPQDVKDTPRGGNPVRNTPIEKPSYTICCIPFLPNADLKLDYSSIRYVDYTIHDSTDESFPIVRAPQLGCPIKYPVIGRTNNRGASEQYFCNKIVEYGLQRHFYDNLSLFIKNLDFPYEPDLAYIDADKGVFLDIEIDEPYVGWERQPIHYKTGKGKTIDDSRNLHFTERGWTVVRFSEKQIREQTMPCLKEIFTLLHKMNANIAIPSKLKNVQGLKHEHWWTENEAEQKMKNKEREKLLNISKFTMPKGGKSRQTTLNDYENGSLVEAEIIARKEESLWKECQSKGNYTRYKRQFPKGQHIKEVKQMEDDILYEECVSQKNYVHYLNVSQTKKHEVKVKELLQKQEKEKQRHEEEERQRKTRELEEIKNQEVRMQEEQRRRAQEEQRKREAERYERQTVTSSNPSPKTPSSRGYA